MYRVQLGASLLFCVFLSACLSTRGNHQLELETKNIVNSSLESSDPFDLLQGTNVDQLDIIHLDESQVQDMSLPQGDYTDMDVSMVGVGVDVTHEYLASSGQSYLFAMMNINNEVDLSNCQSVFVNLYHSYVDDDPNECIDRYIQMEAIQLADIEQLILDISHGFPAQLIEMFLLAIHVDSSGNVTRIASSSFVTDLVIEANQDPVLRIENADEVMALSESGETQYLRVRASKAFTETTFVDLIPITGGIENRAFYQIDYLMIQPKFLPGQTLVEIPMVPADDLHCEVQTENAKIRIRTPSSLDSYVLGSEYLRNLTVEDNDTSCLDYQSGKPTVSFGAFTASEVIEGNSIPALLILSQPAGPGGLEVYFEVANETTSLLNEITGFSLGASPVEFQAGSQAAYIDLNSNSDSLCEENEHIVLRLLDGSGYNLEEDDYNVVLYVIDNDSDCP